MGLADDAVRDIDATIAALRKDIVSLRQLNSGLYAERVELETGWSSPVARDYIADIDRFTLPMFHDMIVGCTNAVNGLEDRATELYNRINELQAKAKSVKAWFANHNTPDPNRHDGHPRWWDWRYRPDVYATWDSTDPKWRDAYRYLEDRGCRLHLESYATRVSGSAMSATSISELRF